MVVDQVVLCRGVIADLRFVEGLKLHFITGVVEVDDVDVEDENSRRGDHITLTEKFTNKSQKASEASFTPPSAKSI